MMKWLAVALLGFSGAATALPDGAAALGHLKAMAGEWQGVDERGRKVRIDYSITARGSVLVETWQPDSAGETLTVMHQDGDTVMATHYCAQGNQPRLVLEKGNERQFDFRFRDATNLADADASHLVRLEYILQADGSLDRVEAYRLGGQVETSRLHLIRHDINAAEHADGP